MMNGFLEIKQWQQPKRVDDKFLTLSLEVGFSLQHAMTFGPTFLKTFQDLKLKDVKDILGP